MPSTQKPAPDSDNSVLRSVASLLLFIHLFCVAVVLLSNVPSMQRSRLERDLLRVFAPYTRLLRLDPELTPYYYTLGRPADDDAWLVAELYPDADQPVSAQTALETVQLPGGGTNLLGERRRWFRLAQMLATSAEPEVEDDDVSAEIARSVGARLMRESGARRAAIRCVRRMSQPFNLAALNPGFPPDRPTDPAYDVTMYEADVWIDEDGQAQVLKRASRAEVAPRQPATRPPSEGTRRQGP
jgi:hypothetical protein